MNPPITFIQQSQNELREEKGEWTTLKDVPDVFEKAIIAAEDQLFFEHHGFDWEAIENAWKHNRSHKRKEVRVPFHNKQPRMYSYGKVEPGFEKG